MFEDSTFESAGKIHTRSRTWGMVAFAVNTMILAALVTIPLIYPEALPKQFMNILMVAPPPPPAAPKPLPQQQTQAFHGQRELVGINLTAPSRMPTGIHQTRDVEGPPADGPISMDNGNTGIPGGDPFGHGGGKPAVVVHEERRGPLTISLGVAEGMVVQRVTPRYPPIAVAARVQGTVVLQAIITKSGTIASLRVVGGTAMLQQAALDAVSQWRYRPYLLDGQPVDVETTINVVFKLGQ